MPQGDLPTPNFDAGRSYWVSGRTLNALIRGIWRRTPLPGNGVTTQETERGVFKTGIRGGVVYAGPNVYSIDPFEINLSIARDDLVWLRVAIEANAADGVLLPGIESSTTPTWNTGSSYPPQNVPTADDPSGTAIIALGRLVVDTSGGTPGTASFTPESCGPATVNHCPGTLSIVRG